MKVPKGMKFQKSFKGEGGSFSIYTADFGPLYRALKGFFSGKKLHCDFTKMRGRGSKAVWNFFQKFISFGSGILPLAKQHCMYGKCSVDELDKEEDLIFPHTR